MNKRGIQPANSFVSTFGRDFKPTEGTTAVEMMTEFLSILDPKWGEMAADLSEVKKEYVALSMLESLLFSEILSITFAPNENKIISHGLKRIPTQRIILRQTGNAVITDVNVNWTDKTIGLLNNSSNAVTLTIGLR